MLGLPEHPQVSSSLRAGLLTAFQRICESEGACSCSLSPHRYCAGTMPWGNPGEHHDFEPQRHDDGCIEVIGFTMTSLVSWCCRWW